MEQLDLAAMAACDSPSLFYLGRVSMTATVDNWAKEHLPAQLYDNNLYAQILLEAHRRGIWGDLPPEDAKLNQQALKPGEEGRIMSSSGTKEFGSLQNGTEVLPHSCSQKITDLVIVIYLTCLRAGIFRRLY